MIDSIVEENLKRIPVIMPLQQFVATNPLWEMHDESIIDASAKIYRATGAMHTLTEQEYYARYNRHDISQKALKQAVLAFCQGNQAISELLYAFAEDQAKKNSNLQLSAHPEPMILISHQVSELLDKDLTAQITKSTIESLANYLSQNTISWVENKQYSFYNHWYKHTFAKHQDFLSQFSQKPKEMLDELISYLELPLSQLQQYLFQVMWQVKGFVGLAKWQNQHPTSPGLGFKLDVIDILCVWLAQEALLMNKHNFNASNFVWHVEDERDDDNGLSLNELQQFCQDYDGDNATNYLTLLQQHYQLNSLSYLWIWQRAAELDFENKLIEDIQSAYQKNKTKVKPRAKSQWCFCIDVRSEGIRRHLEQIDDHETYGVAGFFGFALQLHQQDTITNQCPALIEPQLLIKTVELTQTLLQQTKKHMAHSITQTKDSMLSAFELYNLIGLWYAVVSGVNNFISSLNNTPAQPLMLKHFDEAKKDELSSVAASLLRSIGLTKNFSDLVFLCGHAAKTRNNPYQAALDCGACGGNSGKANAHLAVEILNDTNVRNRLRDEYAIDIPNTTQFIAALHNTTSDEISIFESQLTSSLTQRKHLSEIKQQLLLVKQRLQQERLQTLPGDNNLTRCSLHWAETLPELGLINNAAFIIGSRTITHSLNLQRRVFLHSYEAECDPQGTLLESILLGPVVVAHWINMQYYFSSVDPQHYSSGNKALHNVLPALGVMEGNCSDLKTGLPIQSLFFRGQRMHKPRRLTVLVYAAKETVDAIIDKNQMLKKLIKGQWLFINVISLQNSERQYHVSTSESTFCD